MMQPPIAGIPTNHKSTVNAVVGGITVVLTLVVVSMAGLAWFDKKVPDQFGNLALVLATALCTMLTSTRIASPTQGDISLEQAKHGG